MGTIRGGWCPAHFAAKTSHDHRRDGARPVPGGRNRVNRPRNSVGAQNSPPGFCAPTTSRARSFPLARNGSARRIARECTIGGRMERIVKEPTPLMQRDGKHSRYMNIFPVPSFGRVEECRESRRRESFPDNAHRIPQSLAAALKMTPVPFVSSSTALKADCPPRVRTLAGPRLPARRRQRGLAGRRGRAFARSRATQRFNPAAVTIVVEPSNAETLWPGQLRSHLD